MSSITAKNGRAANKKDVSDVPIEHLQIFFNYKKLQMLCQDNKNFFSNDSSTQGQRLHAAFIGLIDEISVSKKLSKEICTFAHEYDFDEQTSGNGYRSFISAVDKCLQRTIHLSKNLIQSRECLIFRKGWFMQEAESCRDLLVSLTNCLKIITILRAWTAAPRELFPETTRTIFDLQKAYGGCLNQFAFYGRCSAFQFCDSIQGILRFVVTSMAVFSASYYFQGSFLLNVANTLWTGAKYIFFPELKAKQIVFLSHNCGVHFCKAFWFLAENRLMHAMPSVVGTPIKVNRIVSIPPEKLQLKNCIEKSHQFIEIPVPMSCVGIKTIQARLFSSKYRDGMIGADRSSCCSPPSKFLIFHCHGGGFVAQSAKSHEAYLRDWAAALDTPILSIDYSLAPEAPFPRALEEIFYAYCWTLSNTEILGSTGEIIMLAGDSAGATLNIGLTMKCIDLRIRKPDSLFLAYFPILVSFTPSPSRILSLMDPLLPLSFTLSCMRAYAFSTETKREECRKFISKKNQFKEYFNDSLLATEPEVKHRTQAEAYFNVLMEEMKDEQFTNEVHKDPYLSPYFAKDEILKQLPTTKILTTEMDPFVDDCVTFAKRLKRLGVPVTLDILKGLPHGFLNFSMFSKDAYEGSQICIRRISEAMN